jgi:DNA modification methylase
VFGNALHDRRMLRQTVIWVKDSMVLGRSDYHYRHEVIWFGYTPSESGRRGRGGEGWYGPNNETTVHDIARPKRSDEHPTMKPVELVARALRNSSAPGALVLDPFAGSGTTLIAAEQEGRRARLIELDPKYADVICRRFQQHTGMVPVRDGVEVDFTSTPAASSSLPV